MGQQTSSGGGNLTDKELAEEIINRLNKLCAESEEVRHLLGRLCDTRVNVSEHLGRDHPTIQAIMVNDGIEDHYQVGLLGILNGLVGPHEDNKWWGYIAAITDDDTGELLKFGWSTPPKENPRQGSFTYDRR